MAETCMGQMGGDGCGLRQGKHAGIWGHGEPVGERWVGQSHYR